MQAQSGTLHGISLSHGSCHISPPPTTPVLAGVTAEDRFSNPARRRGKTHLSAKNQDQRASLTRSRSQTRARCAGVFAPVAAPVRWECAFGTFSGGGTSLRLKGFGIGPPRRQRRPPSPDAG